MLALNTYQDVRKSEVKGENSGVRGARPPWRSEHFGCKGECHALDARTSPVRKAICPSWHRTRGSPRASRQVSKRRRGEAGQDERGSGWWRCGSEATRGDEFMDEVRAPNHVLLFLSLLLPSSGLGEKSRGRGEAILSHSAAYDVFCFVSYVCGICARLGALSMPGRKGVHIASGALTTPFFVSGHDLNICSAAWRARPREGTSGLCSYVQVRGE